ncbi:exodeoxyribonuclease VII large subunit [Thalassotalea profundi]|uniref:Exodeoxyribonuclease 7 large subunit n=1 Tax=Thalassotalea profundi TaxID=2036687 RepID=A0ABQ3IX35_9GAMM|nr:exodeoxyribonuclease VII large subunit [Thalassotalea profundi]GHE94476.1 exodeoxyribonuclease 7 large subunit [Thalassotalea profundi]
MAQQHILQVSELTKKVKFMLESELNTVWLSGEISNFVAASSGHWYLSLKDSRSQVRCAMFKGNNQRVRLPSQRIPSNGQQVLVRAKVSLYEPRGDFQLIIELMEDAGEGLLRQQYDQLKAHLNAQGFFSQTHKKSIPAHATTVGIVTSPTGAAIKDILTVLKRRNPTIKVIIYPSLVQGDQASEDIAQAIHIANQRQECDVLIVGRGGGSLEDLWCFNSEVVVNAIYQCQIPVISAVGHEIDTTLSDHVADLRAPTPSAAAEIVSQDNSELINKVLSFSQRLQRAIQNQLVKNQQVSIQLTHRLSRVHPVAQLQIQQQKSDELHLRLHTAIQRRLIILKHKPENLVIRLINASPHSMISKNQQQSLQLDHRLKQAIGQLLKQKQQSFAGIIEQLNIVSPLATIARGYSVSRSQKNEIIRSVDQVEVEENMTVEVGDGILTGKVLSKQPHR